MNNEKLYKILFDPNRFNGFNISINLESTTIERPFLKTNLWQAVGYSKKIKISAAYCIIDIKSGFCYAGSTSDIGRRIRDHRTMLICKKHDNANIQKAFNESNRVLFDVVIIYTQDREEAYDIEQVIINILKDKNISFNNSPDARIGLRCKPMTDEERNILSSKLRGRLVSLETREKLSKLSKNRIFSKETKLKMSKSASTPERIERIKKFAA